jgi:hypothetical protein
MKEARIADSFFCAFRDFPSLFLAYFVRFSAQKRFA